MAEALGRIGPAAKESVPALIEAFEQKENRYLSEYAARALGRIGPDARCAVSSLSKELEGPELTIACALLRIDPTHEAARRSLIQELERQAWRDEETWHEDYWDDVAELLSEQRDRFPELVAPLTKALRDKLSPVRGGAARALGAMGATAKPAVPELLASLGDDGYVEWNGHEEVLVRDKAAEALVRIGPATLPGLLQAVTHNDVTVRACAARALGGMGGAAVPALTKAFGDEHVRVRLAAAEALERIGPKATRARGALGAALRDPRLPVRIAAARALGNFGPEADTEVTALVSALEDEYLAVRQTAAEALGQIGPPAQAAVPALMNAREDDFRLVRDAATVALKRIVE
jgi:HEAT repeat protein